MILSIKNKASHRLEMGIILAMVGTQISRILMETFSTGDLNLSNTVFAISLILIPDYDNLFKLKFPKFSKYLFLILGYNLYALLAAIIVETPMFALIDGTIYTLYVLVFLFFLLTNKRDIDGEYLVKATWLTTGIFSTLLLYVMTDGLTNLNTSVKIMENGSDRLTLSVVAFYYLCSMLLYKPKTVYTNVLKYFFMAVAMLVMIIVNRRGLMVTYIVILLYHLYSNLNTTIKNIKKSTLIKFIQVVIFVVITLFVVMQIIPEFGLMIESYSNSIIKGVSTYFGDFDSGVDAAAVNRYNNLTSVPMEYLNSDIFTIIFGNGYGYKQLDVPYLQAFTDLGLIGGIYYLIIQLIYPVKIFIIRTSDNLLRFAQYIGIMTVAYNLYSGVPYNNYKFVGLILLAVAVIGYKNRESVKSLKSEVI